MCFFEAVWYFYTTSGDKWNCKKVKGCYLCKTKQLCLGCCTVGSCQDVVFDVTGWLFKRFVLDSLRYAKLLNVHHNQDLSDKDTQTC